MESRDIIFSIVMVVSAFVLTYEWLGRFQYSPANALIVLSAMVMVGALAAMILSVDMRLRKIDNMLEAKERSLRINIQSVEGNLDKRVGEVLVRIDEVAASMDRTRYR
ncbi:MAG: hypothetical protein Q8J68_03130 [Methanolobus sp.]|jgi:divalent metal cation (Fe/Co/Zn/Cd) transporter|uniref:hypothetical protein n=1 Tax=Methanolobus sp. TaxID=1874737 RepID=UPI0027305822|nr:hypothetical protein [Methanolobus sp.]MDP2216265.1 hypothetical protein [Methanolobus sp.]